MLGIGAMLGRLTGNEKSVEAINRAIGQEIKEINCSDEMLWFRMADGFRLGIFDDGQSCCEHRYMTCDDDLEPFVGSTLLGAEVRTSGEADADDDAGEYHEIQFLIVQTSKGEFTIATHNVHNGYYGGFDVRCKSL